jgi:hypothetical protein
MVEKLIEIESELIESLKEFGTPGTLLDACIKDAYTRFIPPDPGKPEHLFISYYSWPQIWRKVPLNSHLETANPVHGGRIIMAPTIIVESNLQYDVCVYHAGEFAYYIRKPNELFVKDLSDRKLMSAMEYRRRSNPYDSLFTDLSPLKLLTGKTIN